MLEHLWGFKTLAVFDVWTIEHFISGISLGAVAVAYNKTNLEKVFNFVKDKFLSPKEISKLKFKYALFIILFAAYIWEALEHYLEAGLAGGQVAYWFQGVEFWANRLISDPLMLVLGFLLVNKYAKLAWPARIFSFIWLFLHIFVFPHSMYLHELLF